MTEKSSSDQVYFISDMIQGCSSGTIHPYSVVDNRILLTKEEANRTLATAFVLRPEDKELYVFKLEKIVPRKKYVKKGK